MASSRSAVAAVLTTPHARTHRIKLGEHAHALAFTIFGGTDLFRVYALLQMVCVFDLSTV